MAGYLVSVGGCGGRKGLGGVDGSVERDAVVDASEPDTSPDGDGANRDAPKEGGPLPGCPANDAGTVGEPDAAMDGATDLPPGCFIPQVEDPQFRSATAWTPSRGGAVACGEAHLDVEALCDRGSIAQTLATPPLACARPLILDVTTTILDNDHSFQSVAVQVGGGWRFFELPNHPGVTTAVCLGASAFGGPVDLSLAAGSPPGCSPDSGSPTLVFDRVAIRPDDSGQCPAVGQVTNGDFERGASGWTFSGGVTESNAVVEDGVGRGATRGLWVHAPCGGSKAASSSVSLPSAALVHNPALHVWLDGTPGASVTVRLGEQGPRFEAILRGEGRAVERTICIPRWAQGTVQPITLWVQASGLVEADGSNPACTQAADVAFDDLTVVSDPACPEGAPLFDPGFELSSLATSPVTPWTRSAAFTNPLSGSSEIVVDPAFSHAGTAAAALTADGLCSHSELAQIVTVPASVGSAGPALAFWYKTDASQTTAQVVSTALPSPFVLSAAGAWTRAKVCLDPRLAGWPSPLTFQLVSPGGGCASHFSVETFAIDDIELTTDAACPVGASH